MNECTLAFIQELAIDLVILIILQQLVIAQRDMGKWSCIKTTDADKFAQHHLIRFISLLLLKNLENICWCCFLFAFHSLIAFIFQALKNLVKRKKIYIYIYVYIHNLLNIHMYVRLCAHIKKKIGIMCVP